MASYNKVQLIGNITKKPELRYTTNGISVCDFTVAVNEKRKDKEHTVFIDCTAWDKLATVCEEYLDKGSSVFVDGRIDVEDWTDKETGKKRTKMKVTASNVQFLGGKKSEGLKREEVKESTTDIDAPF